MWRHSGESTMSLMVATSVAVSWPGFVRGHDERSVSSQAFSARRQAWYRPESSPRMRRMIAKGREASALEIARRMLALASPTGRRFPSSRGRGAGPGRPARW